MSCWYLFTAKTISRKKLNYSVEGFINPVALSAVRSTITNNAGDRRKGREQNRCAEKTLIS